MHQITCKDNSGNLVNIHKSKFQFRPSVYGIIRNQDNDNIVILKTRNNHKTWLPGGGVDCGEKLEAALLREILEETGLTDVKIVKLVCTLENFFYYEPTDNAMHAYLFFYLCETNQTDLKSNQEIDDEDCQDSQWVNLLDIKKEDLADLNEEIFAILHQAVLGIS